MAVIYKNSASFTATGTVAISIGSTTITGTSTSFDTELSVGDRVLINNEYRYISSVTSATIADVTANFTTTVSGVSMSVLPFSILVTNSTDSVQTIINEKEIYNLPSNIILGDPTEARDGSIYFNSGNFSGYNGGEQLLDVQSTSGTGGWTEVTNDRIYTTDADVKNLVLGRTGSQFTKSDTTERITNGNFATDTDWTYDTGWTIDTINGKAIANSTTSGVVSPFEISQSLTGLTENKTYTIGFTLGDTSQWAAAGDSYLNIYLVNGADEVPVQLISNRVIDLTGSYFDEDDYYEFSIIAPSSSCDLVFRAYDNFQGSITGVTFKEDNGFNGKKANFEFYGTDDNVWQHFISINRVNGYDNQTGRRRAGIAFGMAVDNKKIPLIYAEDHDRFSNYSDIFIQQNNVRTVRFSHYGDTYIGDQLCVGDKRLYASIVDYTITAFQRSENAKIALRREDANNTWVLVADADDKFHIRDDIKLANRITIDTNGNVGIKSVSSPEAELHINGGIKLSSSAYSVNGLLQYDGEFKGYDGEWTRLCTEHQAYTVSNWTINDALLNGCTLDENTKNTSLTTGYTINNGEFMLPSLMSTFLAFDTFKFRTIEVLEYYDGASWQTWTIPSGFTNIFDGNFDSNYSIPVNDGGIDRRKFRFVINMGTGFTYVGAIGIFRGYVASSGYVPITIKIEHGTSTSSFSATELLSETTADSNAMQIYYFNSVGQGQYLRITIDATQGAAEDCRINEIVGLTVRPEYCMEQTLYTWDYNRNITTYGDLTVGGAISMTGNPLSITKNTELIDTLNDTQRTDLTYHNLVVKSLDSDNGDFASLAFSTGGNFATGLIAVVDSGSSSRADMRFYTSSSVSNTDLRERLRIEEDGDIIFNVEYKDSDFTIRKQTSGNAYVYNAGTLSHTFYDDVILTGATDSELFFVDSSADKIGISTTTPSFTIDIDKSITAGEPLVRIKNFTNYPILRFDTSESEQPGNLGQLEWYNSSVNTDEVVGYIRGIRGDSSYSSSGIEFYVSEETDTDTGAITHNIFRIKGAKLNKNYIDFNVGAKDTDVRFYKEATGEWLTYAGDTDYLTINSTRLGFYGATPVVKPTALTTADASIVDTTYGQEESDVINNLRTRLNELESKLQGLGLLT